MATEISTSNVSCIETVSSDRRIGRRYRLIESKEYRIYIISVKNAKVWHSYFLELPENTIISVLKTDVNEFHPDIFHGAIELGSIDEDYVIYGVFDFTENLSLLDEPLSKFCGVEDVEKSKFCGVEDVEKSKFCGVEDVAK